MEGNRDTTGGNGEGHRRRAIDGRLAKENRQDWQVAGDEKLSRLPKVSLQGTGPVIFSPLS